MKGKNTMKISTNIIYATFPVFALACFAVSPTAQAVSPPPDGGYAGGNTAEGQNALLRRWFQVRVPADPIQQIAQRILWPIQSKDEQTSSVGRLPITLWLVADVKDLVRFEID